MRPSSLPLLIAQSGGVVSDPGNERVIRFVIIGLVVAGLMVLLVTAWFWRSTRPEPAALATLELMSRRRFIRHDRSDISEPPGPSDPRTEPGDEGTDPIDPLLRSQPPIP